MLGILDLFTEETPAWTADMLIEELGLTRATTYRYIRSLNTAGLIAPGAASTYVLGPRFIQIDRQIQRSDPLLRIAAPLLKEDSDPVLGAKFLCGFYGDQVLSVYVEKTDPDISLTMERGRTFPLLYGAPSKIILSYLPSYQLKNVYLYNEKEIREANLGNSWFEFRATLKEIRKAGYCIGSQLDASVVGVAAPIFHAPNAVSASLCYVRQRAISTPEDLEIIKAMVISTAAKISQQLLDYTPEAADYMGAAFPTPRIVK